MTPEQAASKFISNIPMPTDRHLELVEALTILIHAQRAEAVSEYKEDVYRHIRQLVGGLPAKEAQP